MPSIKIITPILGGSYYHIFNRGINRQLIFFSNSNYDYFLKLLDKYLSGYVEFLAYSLMPNHFHLVVKVKDKLVVIKDSISKKKMESEVIISEEEVGKIVSKQFRRLFIAYSMAINKQESRVGSLFDKNFKRLEISSQEYLEYAIFYTHYNPEKHAVVSNFKKYKYSSYKTCTSERKSKINRMLVWNIFGGKDDFISYHKGWHDEKEKVVME